LAWLGLTWLGKNDVISAIPWLKLFLIGCGKCIAKTIFPINCHHGHFLGEITTFKSMLVAFLPRLQVVHHAIQVFFRLMYRGLRPSYNANLTVR